MIVRMKQVKESTKFSKENIIHSYFYLSTWPEISNNCCRYKSEARNLHYELINLLLFSLFWSIVFPSHSPPEKKLDDIYFTHVVFVYTSKALNLTDFVQLLYLKL